MKKHSTKSQRYRSTAKHEKKKRRERRLKTRGLRDDRRTIRRLLKLFSKQMAEREELQRLVDLPEPTKS